MSSIIEGYNYDIFISYRQKDNKGDSWVSEFVEALKAELESTFKEEISLYFDVSAHDGLLETHDVEASLKEKLKCLIFIPVLSRTYCDPRSFAWEHEFKLFVEQAAGDRFGMMVKLPDGNVAGRVLPVRIHDLDPSDIKEFESVLGGVLRGVQFIYKEPGVNRSLTPSDHEERNLNNTNYRNQINKVALAVKEIISGLKREAGMVVSEKSEPGKIPGNIPVDPVKGPQEKSATGSARSKVLPAIIITACVLMAALFAYPKIFKTDKLQQLREKGEISVAVMPFQNLTGDTLKNFWQQMIQENMVSILSNSEELKVRQTESVITLLENKDLKNYASLTPSLAREVSEKLEANVFVQGSVSQVGKSARLNAKLVDSETEEVFQSFKLEGPVDSILVLADSISLLVQDFLVITILKKNMPKDLAGFVGMSRYPEAVKYMIDGQKAFASRDYREACSSFHQALQIDSDYYNAALFLSVSYGNRGLLDDAKKWVMKAYDNRNKIARIDRLYAEFTHSIYFGTPYESIDIGKKLIELNDQAAPMYYNVGFYYLDLEQYDNAITELEKALEKYDDWDIRPMWVYNYTVLGEAYHELGMYRKEKILYKKAGKDFPGDFALIRRQAILALAEGRTADAKEYIDRYVSILEERSATEATIAGYLGGIYLEAEIPERAEEHYRRALELEPERALRLNSLGYFLIDTDIDIDEGLVLVEKALETEPDNASYLDSKGWGLYKKGLYQEALEILERAWELKPTYSHELYLHLECVRKAVAGR